MKKLLVIALLAASTLTVGCGRIETGYIGVRTDFNKTVETVEVPVGFYGAVLTSVDEYVIKETEIQFDNLTPKAKDNLSLADLDVSVFYTINPAQVAEVIIKYAGQTFQSKDGDKYPGWGLITTTARGAIYDSVSKFDSLLVHTQRNELEAIIKDRVQQDLDLNDKGAFTITRVIVRQLVTDKSLEASIQQSVRVQKEIEAKKQQIDVARAEAERQRVEAEGNAKRNKIISESITPQLIEFQKAKAMSDCATNQHCTMLIGVPATPMINIK